MKGEDIKAGSNFILSNNNGRIAPVVAAKVVMDIKLIDVLGLIKELALFEKEPDEVEISQDELVKDGFGKKKSFKCFVAEFELKVVGMALFYPRYSTWKGNVLHLEDLIVTKKFRGKGIGYALFSEFIKYAYNKKVKRVQWVVLNWNDHAINFYKRNGGEILNDWRVTVMNKNSIKKFVKNESI